MLALGNRNSPGGHQRAMLPEHVGTGDFILSPQVLKGGFAFLPLLLDPGLPRSDLGSILHRQQWLLMSLSSLKAGLKNPCCHVLSLALCQAPC